MQQALKPPDAPQPPKQAPVIQPAPVPAVASSQVSVGWLAEVEPSAATRKKERGSFKMRTAVDTGACT